MLGILVGWSIWWFVRFGGCVCLRFPDWFMSIYVDGRFDVPTNVVVVRVPICSVCGLFLVSVVSVFSVRICVFVGRVCFVRVTLDFYLCFCWRSRCYLRCRFRCRFRCCFRRLCRSCRRFRRYFRCRFFRFYQSFLSFRCVR